MTLDDNMLMGAGYGGEVNFLVDGAQKNRPLDWSLSIVLWCTLHTLPSLFLITPLLTTIIPTSDREHHLPFSCAATFDTTQI